MNGGPGDLKRIGNLVVPADRIVERGRRCQNCRHYDAGPRAVETYRALRAVEITDDPVRAFSPSLGAARGAHRQTPHEPCACGSGRKYESCCATLHEADRLAQAAIRREQAKLSAIEEMIRLGVVGICSKGRRSKQDGGPDGDFVDGGFLCDRWTGVDGATAATEGHPIDPLPAELRNKLGDPE